MALLSPRLEVLVKPHVEALIQAKNRGDKNAAQVIICYNMHVQCPGDPGAVGLCEAALGAWLRSKDEPAS